jgi:hypothetical protein
MKSVVVLQGWYAQPIHCPFCGEKIEPPETIGCKHHLYLIFSGQFVYVGENLVKTLGLPEDPFLEDPYDASWDTSEFGTVDEIVAKAASAFVSLRWRSSLC